jgi:hypothetical protein
MPVLRRVASLALALSLAACGGASPPAGSPAPAPATSSAPAAAPGPDSAVATAEFGAWKDVPAGQRGAFMKAKVVPRMSQVFQAAAGAHETKFGCKTCHGPDMKAPKAFLPALTMRDGKLTAFAEKPEAAKFMAEKVLPAMAAALGEPIYDPATKQGFGCGGCHSIEMK